MGSEPAHQALKDQIQGAAEKLGFEVEPEKKLLSGKRIDLVLESERLRFACEIARTNPADWETGNVEKCFEEVFDHVVVVCETTDRLLLIREQVLKRLTPEQTKRVLFRQPNELVTWLQKIAEPRKPRKGAGQCKGA